MKVGETAFFSVNTSKYSFHSNCTRTWSTACQPLTFKPFTNLDLSSFATQLCDILHQGTGGPHKDVLNPGAGHGSQLFDSFLDVSPLQYG